MTRSDIIKMAKEAGFETAQDWVFNPNGFVVIVERFAAIVAAAEREAIIDLVAMHGGSVEIEAAIRARSNT